MPFWYFAQWPECLSFKRYNLRPEWGRGESVGVNLTDVKLHVSPRVVFAVDGVAETLASVTQVLKWRGRGLW